LGAAFLGAKSVVGIDLDRETVAIALATAGNKGLKAKTNWVAGDIAAITGKIRHCCSEPTFWSAENVELTESSWKKALEVGCSVYSLHNHPRTDERLTRRLKNSGAKLVQVEASSFIERFAEERNGSVLAVYAFLMSIPHMFQFHTKLKRDIIIDLYIIRKSQQ